MILDSTTIPLDTLKPNTLLVLRVDAGTPSQLQSDMLKVHAVFQRAKLPEGCKVLIMPSTMSLKAVSERVMKRAGWVRQRSPAL